MIKGWKKLTKKEISHLKENECNNTVLFQRTIDVQAKMSQENERARDLALAICYDCKRIAEKLGMSPEGGWQ